MKNYQCSLNPTHIAEGKDNEQPYNRCNRLTPYRHKGNEWVAYRCQGTLTECEPMHDLRLYDGFDRTWISIKTGMSKPEADKLLATYTGSGSKNSSYGDIDYYSIFPSHTRMIYSLDRELLDICTRTADEPLPTKNPYTFRKDAT